MYFTTPFLGRLLPSPLEYGPWAHILRRRTGITSSQHLTTVTCQQAWGVRVKIDRLLVWPEHSYRRPKKETHNLGRELLRKPSLKISELTEPSPKFTKGSATNNKLLNRLERPYLSKTRCREHLHLSKKIVTAGEFVEPVHRSWAALQKFITINKNQARQNETS